MQEQKGDMKVEDLSGFGDRKSSTKTQTPQTGGGYSTDKEENIEMKKIERENQDDNFVNVYAEGFFFRCKEHSAVLVSKLKNYRIYLNICKKNNFVFLECGFPAGNVFELKNMLKELGYNYRIYGGNRKVDEILEELTGGKTAFPKNKDELIEIKKGLITI